MWCIAEAAACNRRALARLYCRYSTHDVPGKALCGNSETEGRASGPVGDEEVACQGRDPAHLPGEVPQGVSLSLPPVSLPKALEQAVKRVLANYPIKSLRHDSDLLVHHLLGRTPPSTELLQRRKRKRQSQTAATQNREGKDDQEGEEVSGWEAEEVDSWDRKEVDDWDRDDVQMNARKKKKAKYSPIRYNRREAITYIASRLNATYSASFRVLNEIARRCPDFKPETLLDFGSGVGTTVWAANELWSSSVFEYQCIDVSDEVEKVARLLRQGGEEEGESCIPGVYFKQYLPVTNQVTYDLVVSAYSLCEIPTIALRKSVVRNLWEKTNDFLVLIELGNLPGFSIIAEARDMLLEGCPANQEPATVGGGEEETSSEGHLFAPCPHDAPCPLVAKYRTCFFGQRNQLSIVQKHTPLRHMGYNIEKFSYTVLRKGPRQRNEELSRVLQPVKKRSRHIICSLCTPDGSAREQIFTKGKSQALYRVARSCKWGDLLEVPGSSQTSTTQDTDDSD